MLQRAVSQPNAHISKKLFSEKKAIYSVKMNLIQN